MEQKFSPLDYAHQGCDALMTIYTPEQLPPAGRFFYHQGVFLLGVERLWKITGERKYFDYIKAFADCYIDENGNIPTSEFEKLDGIEPAFILFDIYEETGDERYKKVIDTLVNRLKIWKTTIEGGYWHRWSTPNQMWLDGLYMVGPISVRYASVFGDESFYEMAHNQVVLMKKYLRDEETGLMYHAWDGDRAEEWANPVTGRSPEFWGRAIGWYTVALLDMLDYLPKDCYFSGDFKNDAVDLINALIKYQNPENGTWYQLVNRIDDPKNWAEITCTSLYTYAIAKARRKGYIDESYDKYAQKGYDGAVSMTDYDDNGLLILENICIGTNVSDYEYYINRPCSERDLHGFGTFVLMCEEIHKWKNIR